MTINLGDRQLLPYLNDYLQLFDDLCQPEAVCAATVDLVHDPELVIPDEPNAGLDPQVGRAQLPP